MDQKTLTATLPSLSTRIVSELTHCNRQKVGAMSDWLGLARTSQGKDRHFTVFEAAILYLVREYQGPRYGFTEPVALAIASTIRPGDLAKAIELDPEPVFLILQHDPRPDQPPWSTCVMSQSEIETWFAADRPSFFGFTLVLNSIVRLALEAATAAAKAENAGDTTVSFPTSAKRSRSLRGNGVYISTGTSAVIIETACDGHANKISLAPKTARTIARRLCDLAARVDGGRGDA